MPKERLPGTQASLFDFLPNGQTTLFNGFAPKRGRNPVSVAPSTLETITDELDRHAQSRQQLAGQDRLF